MSTAKSEKIEPVQRTEAHRLIEECMLAANVCAADFLQKHGQTTLYRIHEDPKPEKVVALRNFLKEFGIQLGGKNKPSAKDYAQILLKIYGRPDAQLLQTVMLRSLQQAVYSPDITGHFGLAYESYTHFTSPIRRYPDLLVHRAIKAVLAGETYQPGDWQELGKHCSMTERRADNATRDVESWLKCFYMQDKIGECFDGVISSVTGFGLVPSSRREALRSGAGCWALSSGGSEKSKSLRVNTRSVVGALAAPLERSVIVLEGRTGPCQGKNCGRRDCHTRVRALQARCYGWGMNAIGADTAHQPAHVIRPCERGARVHQRGRAVHRPFPRMHAVTLRRR